MKSKLISISDVGICELHKNTMDIIASSVKKAVNLIHSDSLVGIN